MAPMLPKRNGLRSCTDRKDARPDGRALLAAPTASRAGADEPTRGRACPARHNTMPYASPASVGHLHARRA